ncbi:hypothetical protein BO70DRAFT_194361 [Aspergillus heteromorphus CBS 117.55]|uniref:Uncharacterized protein n=1 Tax=Aspergillus heteromorphus CBS 117.55 TaxID=1448321 RepID=A0A317WQM6_9EURO|nr:uncharacterized protein BO70DRAFT_194361 [Aspergillus heteromorphus CBS 117.55]PWY87427.1 hypothetical protein BO70DRAFT_194361 [Aspergillus heteromorphus CBS 117.55]
MSGINPDARREVNNALISAGGAAVGQMIDTANSSLEKRRRNGRAREERENEEKAARKATNAAGGVPG